MATPLRIYDPQKLWRSQVVARFGEVAAQAGAGPLATNATTGFLYVPTTPGTPVGTPAAMPGFVPLTWDSVGHKLYAYDGSWLVVGP